MITKIFKFRYGILAQLSLDDIYTMFDSINLAVDYEFVALALQTSNKFRDYVADTFTVTIDPNVPEYEDLLWYYAGELTAPECTFNYMEFLQAEMRGSEESAGWIKWAFNKHNADKTPLILLRYIICKSLIF